MGLYFGGKTSHVTGGPRAYRIIYPERPRSLGSPQIAPTKTPRSARVFRGLRIMNLPGPGSVVSFKKISEPSFHRHPASGLPLMRCFGSVRSFAPLCTEHISQSLLCGFSAVIWANRGPDGAFHFHSSEILDCVVDVLDENTRISKKEILLPEQPTVARNRQTAYRWSTEPFARKQQLRLWRSNGVGNSSAEGAIVRQSFRWRWRRPVAAATGAGLSHEPFAVNQKLILFHGPFRPHFRAWPATDLS